jgi:hypothetical protein
VTYKSEWATFTYYVPNSRIITKLFKNTNIRTAFKTTNTIRNHLKPREGTIDTCNQSVMYQIKMQRVSTQIHRTNRIYISRYKESIQTIKRSKQNPKYAQDMLDSRHTYGTIDQTLEILHIEK